MSKMDEDGSRTYKKAHEEFVSNNTGTGMLEIVLVSAICPLSVLLKDAIQTKLHYDKKASTQWCFLLEFVCIVIPGILSVTLFSRHLIHLLIFMATLIILLLLSNVPRRQKAINIEEILQLSMSSQRPSITNFRAFVYIATAIMILAVDFDIFPRVFCKTETYGTGLMDIGVGGFIVSNAIVSVEARGKFIQERGIVGKANQLLHAVKSTLPLWILGGARVLSVKAMGYHEHVTEYGLYWNFFFTIAVVRVLSTLVLIVVPVANSWLLSIVLIISYQYLLIGKNLDNYIIDGPDVNEDRRDGFVSANREGLFSCIGYLALYLAAVNIGRLIAYPRKYFKDWLSLLAILLVLDVLLWILLVNMVDDNTQRISRRMANLGYVLWMMSHQLFVLCSMMVVDLVSTVLQHLGYLKQHGSGILLPAVNKNGLAYFLLANLLTGLVNMSIKTVYASSFTGYTVIFGYMFVLSVSMCALYVKNISLKFW